MSESIPQHSSQAPVYPMECFYTEEYLDPIDHELSYQWTSTEYSQFAGSSAVSNTSFSDPFNPPFSPFPSSIVTSGLLFNPSLYMPSPSPNTIPLPTPVLYSNLSSPWMLPNELGDSSPGGTVSIRGSISHLSDGESPMDATIPLNTPAGAGVGGSGSGWPKQQRRRQRENMFQDPRYSTACSEVIDIMASVKVQGDDGIDAVGATSNAEAVAMQKAQNEMTEFIRAQDPEVQRWLNSAARRRIGSDANIKAAATRRAPVQKTEMFKCFWCKLYMTTKGNLSNHVRSHLGFHISFCNECSFSAVTPRIPTRHASSHHNFAALRQRGRSSM